jgi:hypothetical protein
MNAVLQGCRSAHRLGGTVLLNPDPPYEQAQWQEPQPAAPLLEGDDAAGCGPPGEVN